MRFSMSAEEKKSLDFAQPPYRRESVSNLYREHNLLEFDGLHKIAVALFAFKTAKGKIPGDRALPLRPINDRSALTPQNHV